MNKGSEAEQGGVCMEDGTSYQLIMTVLTVDLNVGYLISCSIDKLPFAHARPTACAAEVNENHPNGSSFLLFSLASARCEVWGFCAAPMYIDSLYFCGSHISVIL